MTNPDWHIAALEAENDTKNLPQVVVGAGQGRVARAHVHRRGRHPFLPEPGSQPGPVSSQMRVSNTQGHVMWTLNYNRNPHARTPK